jgi:Family of unknown function (DUF5977)
MQRKLLFIIVFTVFVKPLIAQETQSWGIQLASANFKANKVIPPTPEAAALGKYGNVPVSLFTGTPGISIPLYQLAGNSISVPVQLNYNAGGFNPQEIATWVGLNWSLNAGGVITRSVMGNPDVTSNYFKSPSPLVIPGQFTDPFAYADYMDNLRKGYNEAQPDVYYYNFAGHSGKFCINPDNTIIKKEKNNYIINASVGFAGGSFVTIKDDQGVLYEFMEYESSTITPDDMGNAPIATYTYPSTWYLTKIVSADGYEEIGFTYHTTALEHTQFNNLYQSEADIYESTTDLSGTSNLILTSTSGSVPATVKTKRKYVQQITLKKAGQLVSYIDFLSDIDQRQDLDHNTSSGFPGERLLKDIKVYTKDPSAAFILNKQFALNYSYFSNSGQPPQQWQYKRLRLDNLQEVPVLSGTATPPPHIFTYNDDNLMPNLSSTAMDHWGFYNKSGSTRLVPNATINYTTGNITVTAENRQPSLSGSSSYLINNIKYPAGGSTSFEYELNRAGGGYTDEFGNFISNTTFVDVGGVRIKKITDYSFTNNKAIQKEYQYNAGNALFPVYDASTNFTSYGTVPGGGGFINPCTADFLSKKTTVTISANSVFGLGSVQGSHIGYSRVSEFSSDVSNGQPLGKTAYEYYIGSFNAHDDDIGNGDLLKKSVYDNAGKLLEETSSAYNYILRGAIGAVVPGVVSTQDNKNVLVQYNNPAGGYFYSWYLAAGCAPGIVATKIIKTKYVNAGWGFACKEKQLAQQTVKKYDQLTNSYLATTQKFTYGNILHQLPTSIEQSTSNNEVVVTEKKYPLDYTMPVSGTLDNNTQAIQLLINKNIVGAEVEAVQRRQNADGSNKRYINGMFTAYNPAMPYPLSLYRLETASPLTSLQLSTVSAGNFLYDASYKPAGSFNYLGNGVLVEQSKNMDAVTAYIWDYDYRYATAEVMNAGAGHIAYSSFETNETGNWTTIPGISANKVSGNALTGKCSYNLTSGNTITKTSLPAARQYIVSYWSKNGAVAVGTDMGSSAAVQGSNHAAWVYYEHLLPLNTTSISITAVSANIDELRLFPKDAKMATYTYAPQVGVTSQCTPTNQLLNYEYDGLNRLINIKDDDGNIVKNFKYNYGAGAALTAAPQSLFYSGSKQGIYTKQGCPVGTEPTAVTYTVPYGKYVSSISQADADAKAQTDVNNNGQAYANANGLCYYWNVSKSQSFSKNDCPPGAGGSKCTNLGPVRLQHQILYSVPAHTYSSLVDQATADNLALANIAANGQTYANNTCWCSCGGIGQKMINGICETGTRYNSSTVYLGNGIWQCTFYFVFSDTTVSSNYTENNTTACPIQ